MAKENNDLLSDFPQHSISAGDSKYNIFCKLLPHLFLLGVLKHCADDIEDVWCVFFQGKGGETHRKANNFCPFEHPSSEGAHSRASGQQKSVAWGSERCCGGVKII